MEDRPLISVIVAVYDNADLIRETLDSIFAQDYPNIELIIGNSASANSFSADPIISYINKCRKENIHQVILDENQKNESIARHLEVLREKSHGEIQLCIAANDIWADSGVFTAFADAFERFGPEAECITSRLVLCDADRNITNELPSQETIERLKSMDMEWLRNTLTSRNVLPSMVTAYRRSIFSKTGSFSDIYKTQEEYPAHVRITRMHIPIYFLDQITVKHHGNRTRDVAHSPQAYHLDILNTYLNEVAPYRDAYSASILEQAEKCFQSHQQNFLDGAFQTEGISAAPTGQNTSAIGVYSQPYMRERIKQFLRHISSGRQIQMMLITAALLLLASSFLRGWEYPLAAALCVILYWIGVLCFAGFILLLGINLLFKARQLMWSIREIKGS